MTTVIQIIKQHLVVGGFDGLATEGCGCGIGDLVPCGQDFSGCAPAKKRPMTPEERERWGFPGDYFYEAAE